MVFMNLTLCRCRKVVEESLTDMRDLVAQQFGLGLRRDVPDSQNKQQEAWKGVRLLECETLAA
jgi:hypothetical protein